MRNARFVWSVCLLLLVAAGVALWRIGVPSLWFDEGWSAYAAARPDLLAAAAADATNPPLYYMVLHVAARLWGDSEFGLRLVSLLIGLLAVAVTARWAHQRQGRDAGLISALLLAFMPLVWWAMREARMYTLLMLLAALALLALDRLRRGSAPWAWLTLLAAELAALYTHNTGPVFALWLNGLALLAWVVNRSLRPRPLPWLAGQALVGLLWLPYFVTRFLLLPAANSGLTSTADLSPTGLSALWQGLWQTPWERVLFGGEAFWPFALLLALFALVMLLRWRGAAWPLASAVLLVGGVLAGLLVLGNEPHSRYLVVAAPFVALAYAGAVARFRRTTLRALLLLPPLALFAANFAYNLSPEAPFQHDDARSLVRRYAETLGPQDTVLAWSYADRYELAYYWERLGVTARRVTLPEGAPRDAVLPLLPSTGDVAINVWYTQRADYRGMLDCLLADGSAAPPEVTTVHGLSSRLYRGIAPVAPAMQPAAMVFGANAAPLVELAAAGALVERAADRALCLPLEFTLAGPVSGDLKAAVVVLNAFGDEIARADAVLATAAQRTTSALASGETVEAYPLLRLPPGTPPGAYPVYLRVYDETREPSGYSPLGHAVVRHGRDGLIGRWIIPPGAHWAGASPDLPSLNALAVSDNLTLLAHDGVDLPVLRNGDRVAITLLWAGEGDLPPLELVDSAGRWSVSMPAPVGPHDALTRDWRAVIIPASAESGEAVLRLPDGAEIGRWPIETLPLETALPPFDTPLSAELEGVGLLAGFSGPGVLSLDTAPEVTLVWQAGDRPIPVSYTVFVQLLDGQGRVIAQSDALPAGGARPTTGWRAGEVIVDAHLLQWNGLAAPGPVTLVAGMYDAATGARVPLVSGGDRIELAAGLRVEG